jgi:hypothetical protein
MLQEHGLPDAAVAYNPNITFFPRVYDRHDSSLRIALVNSQDIHGLIQLNTGPADGERSPEIVACLEPTITDGCTETPWGNTGPEGLPIRSPPSIRPRRAPLKRKTQKMSYVDKNFILGSRWKCSPHYPQ